MKNKLENFFGTVFAYILIFVLVFWAFDWNWNNLIRVALAIFGLWIVIEMISEKVADKVFNRIRRIIFSEKF